MNFDPSKGFTASERVRYSRHVLLPELGWEGQARLKGSRVLIVGAGGLGSPAALYLAAAGVGTIGIVEFDTIDSSNLQRQILYTEREVGTSKIAAAGERLKSLNSNLCLESFAEPFSIENGLKLVSLFDLVLDGSDNFSTRYLVSDACVIKGKPYVYGSIFRFDGQASVFMAGHGPCYRCLFPSPPEPEQVPSCAEGGVLGVLPGLIGTIQATEAIKLITKIGEPLVGRLLTYDALSMSFQEFKLRRNPNCSVCGTNPTIRSLIDSVAACEIKSETPSEKVEEISALALRKAMAEGLIRQLVDVRSAGERAICQISGSVHIPLDQCMARVSEIENGAVFYCKSGVRSAKAARLLQESGRTGRSLKGGILSWIDEVDGTLTRY